MFTELTLLGPVSESQSKSLVLASWVEKSPESESESSELSCSALNNSLLQEEVVGSGELS